MTEKEWIELAESYELRADVAYSHGDEIEAEYLARKAQACRVAACYGTIEDPKQEPHG